MAISYVSFGSAEAVTSITLPSYLPGDVAVCLAFRDATAVIPSLPAGWTSILTVTTGGSGSRLGYRFLISGDTVSGTWTNASEVNVHVLRDVAAIGASAVGTGNTALVTVPALTLQVGNGSSWVVSLTGHRTEIIDTDTPTGMTNRSGPQPNRFCCGADTNAGVATFASTTFDAGNDGAANRQWHAYSVEVFQAPVPRVEPYRQLLAQ